MNPFRKIAAIRIAVVSIILSSIASPISWIVARENAEESIVSQAIEETDRLLHHHEAIDLVGADAADNAVLAAKTIAGGLFDIAEIYDKNGRKLAESMTNIGESIEDSMPQHGNPHYTEASYESVYLPNDSWVIRVFVPLRIDSQDMNIPITGYFEGVRVVPEWKKKQIFENSLTSALMVGFAALLCGVSIYPVVINLASDNERKSQEVLDSHISMMEALGRAIAKRDSDTGMHNYRVAWIAASIAERMGLMGSSMQSLIAGSFLHDVGKIGIPDAILLKPGKLDSEEFSIMRTHVEHGMEIVTGMGWLHDASDVVAAHHEKWDGTGYPNNIKGVDIPLSASIFAVADVFDALCSKRPYKQPLSFDVTMSILEKDTGSHFNPAVMAIFRKIAKETYDRLENCTESEVCELLKNRVRKHFGL